MAHAQLVPSIHGKSVVMIVIRKLKILELLAPSFVNVLNVYAFCNLHDVS